MGSQEEAMAHQKPEQGKQHPVPQQSQQKQGQQQQQPGKQGMQRRGEREMQGLGGYGWGNELSPFTMMRRMFEDMDRLFEDFGLGFGSYGRGLMGGVPSESGGMSQWWSPHIDVARRGDSLVVTADLPGLREEDVRVEVEEGVLTISGERKQESEDESGGVYRSERRYGSFHREIGLPEGIDLDSADASFKDGVLQVTIKLNEPKTQSKKIAINKGSEQKPAEAKTSSASESSPDPVEGSPELKNIH
jgi:HSP20 family protein